jgi:glucosamine-phosphate N-acetyltransferase
MNNFSYDSLIEICTKNKNNNKIIENVKEQYISLLSFLTNAPNISSEHFINQLDEISKMGDIIICYFVNIESKELTIIGSGTIIYEPKIIHGCKNVGHIEDIVVHNNYRSKGIAKNILDKLIGLANQKDCYKVILDCKSELIPFYENNGFQCNGNQMSKYF